MYKLLVFIFAALILFWMSWLTWKLLKALREGEAVKRSCFRFLRGLGIAIPLITFGYQLTQ